MDRNAAKPRDNFRRAIYATASFNACGIIRVRETPLMSAGRNFPDRIRRALRLHDAPPFVRRVIVGVIGGTVLLIGIALVVLPGPALLVIPLGLAILGTEFVWARRWLQKARSFVSMGNNRKQPPSRPSPGADAS